jgi:site-specific recombinase XerD
VTEIALSLEPADGPDAQLQLVGSTAGPVQLRSDGVDTAVARWATAWLLSHAPATRATYAGDVRDWLTWCADVGVDPTAARRVDVDAWVERLRELGAAPATIGKRLAAVSGLYRYGRRRGLADAQPGRARPPPTGRAARRLDRALP